MQAIPTSTPYLDMAVTHLNAPVGAVVQREDLVRSLQSGSLDDVRTPAVQGVLAYLFVELSPEAITRCSMEAGALLERVHRLYEQILAEHMPPVPAWEQFAASWR